MTKDNNNNNNNFIIHLDRPLVVDQAILVEDVESLQQHLLDSEKEVDEVPVGYYNEMYDAVMKRLRTPTAMFSFLLGMFVPLFVSFNTVVLELAVRYFFGKGENKYIFDKASMLFDTVEWYYIFTAIVLFVQYLIFKFTFLNNNVRSIVEEASPSLSSSLRSCSVEVADSLEGWLEIVWHVSTFFGMVTSLSSISYFIGMKNNSVGVAEAADAAFSDEGGLTLVVTLSTFIHSGIVIGAFYVTVMACMCTYLVHKKQQQSNNKKNKSTSVDYILLQQ